MATSFERFRSKLYLAWDAMQRIGPPDEHTEETALRDQAYLEGQLGRLEINAKRAAAYLSEMQQTGTVDTDLEIDATLKAANDLLDIAVDVQALEDAAIANVKDGTNGRHEGEVQP